MFSFDFSDNTCIFSGEGMEMGRSQILAFFLSLTPLVVSFRKKNHFQICHDCIRGMWPTGAGKQHIAANFVSKYM